MSFIIEVLILQHSKTGNFTWTLCPFPWNFRYVTLHKTHHWYFAGKFCLKTIKHIMLLTPKPCHPASTSNKFILGKIFSSHEEFILAKHIFTLCTSCYVPLCVVDVNIGKIRRYSTQVDIIIIRAFTPEEYHQRKSFIDPLMILTLWQLTKFRNKSCGYSYLWYKTPCRRENCWSLRCSWSSACRRSSNYVIIPDLTPGFNGLSKGNCKMRWETFKLWDLECLILEVWQCIISWYSTKSMWLLLIFRENLNFLITPCQHYAWRWPENDISQIAYVNMLTYFDSV